MADILKGILICFLMGLPFLALGMAIRLGMWKSWYLQRYYPVIAMKRSRHLAIPIGLIWFLLPICLLTRPEGPAAWNRVTIMGFGVLLVGIALAIWEPGWMNPTWQRRLEAQYDGGTIRTLIAKWRKMDRKEWGGLIETQQGLDELVRRAGVPVATTDRHGRPIER
jgi:hypothetical protein